MIRVLIVDDQALVRGGFRLILEAQRDIEVVAEASDGREALDRARELRVAHAQRAAPAESPLVLEHRRVALGAHPREDLPHLPLHRRARGHERPDRVGIGLDPH